MIEASGGSCRRARRAGDGYGGCIPGDPEFLETLQAGATTTGAVLMFDEVMTSRVARAAARGSTASAPT